MTKRELLYGFDDEERLVGLHAEGDDKMRLYTRGEGGGVTSRTEDFYPFGHFTEPALDKLSEGYSPRSVDVLSGPGGKDRFVTFSTQKQFWSARGWLSQEVDPGEYDLDASLTSQYLQKTGKTLFGGMSMEDILRMQIDLEVQAPGGKFPNAERAEDEIIMISVATNGGLRLLLHQTPPGGSITSRDEYDASTFREVPSEKTLIKELVKTVHRYDPDVLEFHNGFDFDLSYLDARAKRYGVNLALGRDNKEPRTFPSKKQFAEREQEYTNFICAGRSVIDSFFLAADFDVFARDLPGYGLKELASYFGFADEDRTYVEGSNITEVWREEPMRLMKYALDDAIETRKLVEKLGTSTFELTKILPAGYQEVMSLGTASSIEILMKRTYIRQGEAVPKPEDPDPPKGGYTEVFRRGVYRDLAYADVSSLYPTNMIIYGIDPDSDSLGIFRPLLKLLTDLRLKAKERMRSMEEGPEKDTIDAKQQAFKVLINCFTPGHEIMTAEGVKPVSEVEEGELVQSLNPETGDLEWKPVTRTYTQENYTGEVIRMKNRYVDLEVTPNHKMYTKHVRPSAKAKDRYEWRDAEDLLKDTQAHQMPEFGSLDEGKEVSEFDLSKTAESFNIDYKEKKGEIKDPRRQSQWIPKLYDIENVLRFIGWYVSEGSVYVTERKEYENTTRGVAHQISIANKTDQERDSIRALLKNMGLPFYESQNGFTISNKIWGEILIDMLGQRSGNKKLPDWLFLLPASRLQTFFDSAYQGDGDKRGPEEGRWRYTTKSERLAADMKQLCLQLGWRSRIARDSGVYRVVIFRDSKYGTEPYIRHGQRERKSYSGPIHCLEVADNHTVYAGKNGKLNWVGQSFYGATSFAFFSWNDYEDSAKITRKGRKILKRLIHELNGVDGTIVLCDTDGVMFELPEEGMSDEEVDAFIGEEISSRLPEGIEIDNDGRFERVVSYKRKNYAKIPKGGGLDDISLAGNSLIGRGVEEFLRQYIQHQMKALAAEDVPRMAEVHEALKSSIMNRDLAPDQIKKRGRLKMTMDEYADSPSNLARYEVARKWQERTGKDAKAGDTFWYYVAGSEESPTVFQSARLIEDYEQDENRHYLMQRLDDTADIFRSMVTEPGKVFSMEASPPGQESLFRNKLDVSGVEVVSEKVRELPPNPPDKDLKPEVTK